MSSLFMFEIYDYTNDRVIGKFQDYDDAEISCDEYISNYGEPVEAVVQPCV